MSESSSAHEQQNLIQHPVEKLTQKIRNYKKRFVDRRIKKIRQLLTQVPINQPDASGWTPLNLALYQAREVRQFEIIYLLLNHPEIDVNQSNGDEQVRITPLYLAVHRLKERPEMAEVIETLIRQGADPNQGGVYETPFVMMLLRHYSMYPAIIRHMKGQITPRVFRRVLQYGSLGALEWVLSHHPETALTEPGMVTPLEIVLRSWKKDAAAQRAQRLLKAGITDLEVANSKGMFPIHLAIAYRNQPLFAYCLNHQTDLNILDPLGYNILMLTVEPIEWLSRTMANRYGTQKLKVLTNSELCLTLLSHDRLREIDFTACNYMGDNIFTLCLRRDYLDDLYLALLKFVPTADVPDGYGRTPLMYLVQHYLTALHQADELWTLIRDTYLHTADLDRADGRGITPRSLLERAGMHRWVQALEKTAGLEPVREKIRRLRASVNTPVDSTPLVEDLHEVPDPGPMWVLTTVKAE